MLDAVLPVSSINEPALKGEIVRLNKIIRTLMDRAESSTGGQASDFSLFQTAVMLEEQVHSRTAELRRRQERLELVLQASNTGLWQWDPISHVIDLSSTIYSMMGYAAGEFSANRRTLRRLVHPDDWSAVCRTLYDAFRAPGDTSFTFELRMRDKVGDWRWIRGCGRITERDQEGRVRRVVGVNSDISERKWNEVHEQLRGDILEKLAIGLELPLVLDALVRGVESDGAECLASILLVDDNACLRNVAASRLPEAFCTAIEGLRIGEGVGSCGTAAFRGERVIVEDIGQHPYWEGYRALAASAGLAACWSQPVFNVRGRVVAAFAIYSRRPKVPCERDLATLVHAAHLASIAINHHRGEQRLQMAMQALETTSESVHWLDEYGRILYVNPAMERGLGYSAAELLQMHICQIDPNTPVETLRRAGEQMRTMKGNGLRKFETLYQHRDGHLIPVEVDADPFCHDGRMFIIAIASDISKRQAAEQALRKSEAKFAALFSLTPDPMALTRLADGVVLEISRSYTDYFGYRPDEAVGRRTLPDDLGLWVDAEHRRQWSERIRCDGEILGFEAPMRRKDGSIVTALISGKVLEMDGEACVIVNFHDITERKQHAEHLERIAYHDPLTGLPNRLLLDDRLRQAIAHNQRAGTCFALCYLDLDGFKQVNDRFGHQIGDQILVDVANRLTDSVRAADTVARLGGDEFVVLLSGLADDEECRTALERLLQTVSAPYSVGKGDQAGISTSIGVTLFPNDSADSDTLIRHADHAMYIAKQAGKNRYQLFDMRLEQRIEARHATLVLLAEALIAGEFRLHYQPKVDCRQGRIVGAEALIRWQHPTLGLLSPAEFIPLLEDADLAIPVGEWVIREALSQIVRWRRAGIVGLHVSVNAFARHLLQPGFATTLAAILNEYPAADPHCLQIEIVETAALKDLDAIRQVIEDCGKLGVTFSLDDFGTGYSTLAHLRHLPATEIKIDQSFVRHMMSRTEDLAIVDAVIGLGRAFGRSVVAEGVETTAHIESLMALGCEIFQGYALARPMPADDFLRWVREFIPDPTWQPPSAIPPLPEHQAQPQLRQTIQCTIPHRSNGTIPC